MPVAGLVQVTHVTKASSFVERCRAEQFVGHATNQRHPREATCEMMGASDKFDQALPELHTYPESEIAAGETT
jgi:hypothetical protein